MSAKRILFVCTGNSCRSVMAERLLRHILQRAGVDTVAVESAGAFAMDGMGPTAETLRVLQDAGIDGRDHRSRRLTTEMIQAADLIFAMEQLHADEIVRWMPHAQSKVHLLNTHGLFPEQVEGSPNIADPIGKPLEVYEVCFSQISEAVERVAKSLGVHSR